MILDLLKPQLVSFLINKGVCKRYNQASFLIDTCIQNYVIPQN
jgi:hypothetical protein